MLSSTTYHEMLDADPVVEWILGVGEAHGRRQEVGGNGTEEGVL